MPYPMEKFILNDDVGDTHLFSPYMIVMMIVFDDGICLMIIIILSSLPTNAPIIIALRLAMMRTL